MRINNFIVGLTLTIMVAGVPASTAFTGDGERFLIRTETQTPAPTPAPVVRPAAPRQTTPTPVKKTTPTPTISPAVNPVENLKAAAPAPQPQVIVITGTTMQEAPQPIVVSVPREPTDSTVFFQPDITSRNLVLLFLGVIAILLLVILWNMRHNNRGNNKNS